MRYSDSGDGKPNVALRTADAVQDTEQLPRSGAQCCGKASPLWMMPVLFFSSCATIGAMPVFQSLAKENFGKDAQVYFGSTLGAGMVVGIFAGPLTGALSDRFGRKPVLFIVQILALAPAFSMWAFRLDQSSGRFLCFLILLSMSMGGTGQGGMGIMQAYVCDTTTVENRPAMMGRVMGVGMALSSVVAPLCFAWVQDQFGILMFTRVYVCAGLVGPIVVAFIPESKKPEIVSESRTLNPFGSFRLLFSSDVRTPLGEGHSAAGVLRKLFATIFLLYLAKMGFNISAGLYAQEQLGFSTTEAALLSTVYGICQCLGQLAIPLVTQRISRRLSITAGVACGVVSALIIGVPHVPGFVLYFSEGILALSFIAYTLSIAMASEVAPKERVGEAVMVLNLAMALCSGLGPPLFGIVVRAFAPTDYPNGAFLVLAGVMALSLLCATTLPSNAAFAKQPATPEKDEDWVLRSASTVIDAEQLQGA